MKKRIQVGAFYIAILAVVSSAAMLVVFDSPSSYARQTETGATNKIKIISPVIVDKYPLITVNVQEDGKDKEFKGVPLRVILGEIMPGSLGSMLG